MFEHHVKECEMNKAKEVFDVVFPASDELRMGLRSTYRDENR
jgi:hypothetical protein